jgi:Flp pilus assembly pilin Flp
MVEYAILLTMIALVVITILQLLGTNVVAAFTSASAGF